MNLDKCFTKTTVEFSPKYKKDMVKINFFNKNEEEQSGRRLDQILKHIDRFRKMAKINWKATIVSQNSFPSDVGIAASASGFSALTLALASALKLNLNKKKLSILTRLAGSGSACRSIKDGFVEWKKGETTESSFAVQIKDEKYWDLVDIVVVTSQQVKKISSWNGHQLAKTSPYFKARLKELPQRIKLTKKAIVNKNFKLLGEMIEEEAISMHVICMTSKPPIFYWNESSLEIMKALRKWRKERLLGYFTMDAGPNVHVICQNKNAQTLNRKLEKIPGVEFTILNRPSKGAKVIKDF